MSDNPTAVLIDVSGSQVGTQTNPFFISGTLQFPGINLVNNNNIIIGGSGDSNAQYIVDTLTGSLPNAKSHELLQELIHLSDDDGPRGGQWASNLVKDTDPSPFPLYTIWWLSAARAKRIVDSTVTRNGSNLPVTIQWRAYASDGTTVVESYTDTITYSGVFETSRTRSQP